MINHRIKDLLQQLNERVYEKEHIIALSLLSAVAGESIFLLGPPGVAKNRSSKDTLLHLRGHTHSERENKLVQSTHTERWLGICHPICERSSLEETRQTTLHISLSEWQGHHRTFRLSDYHPLPME